jgi:hypothetical protein
MKNIPSKIAVVISISLFALTTHSFAGEKPPTNAVPLSEIVKSIEDKGYSPITEISIDNGVWEAEAYKGSEKRELKVSPTDGSIISDRPDD